MKITGVIAEYDPFHKGHAYQLERARAASGCDYIVVCMSGSVTQRGEIAFQDKAARARMALSCGADAVFDLPVLFVPRSAEVFARGGIGVLAGLGCDALSFGSETDDLGLLKRIAEAEADESEELAARIKEKLAAGESHARARGDAVAEQLGIDSALLRAPNAVLGVAYLKAIAELGADMEVYPVRRLGDHNGAAGEGFASASTIRARLRAGDMSAANELPEGARDYLDMNDIPRPEDDLLLHRLRGMGQVRLGEIADVGEGLECRILSAARQCGTREALLDAVKCKRYTRARLARILICALLDIDKALCSRHPFPPYARLLGCREDAAPLLKELKARASIPLVTDATALKGDELFEIENRASDLRALLAADPMRRAAGAEYTRKFIRV